MILAFDITKGIRRLFLSKKFFDFNAYFVTHMFWLKNGIFYFQ